MKTNTDTNYIGIDYGRGQSNIDRATGIRFGVISQNSISPGAFDDVWTQSEDLTHKAAVADFQKAIAACEDNEELAELLDERLHCRIPAKQWAEELTEDCTFPLGEFMGDIWGAIEDTFNDQCDDCGDRDWLYERDGYKLTNCLNNDVMILSSPYFTYAQFCSPCVPGACNLDCPIDPAGHPERDAHPNRCFCLGHDWFDGSKAPYPVYSVETGELISG